MSVEIRDVAPGLWLWRQPHPDWQEGAGWDAPVSSFCAETGGEVLVIDALAPQDDSVWERLDKRPPTVAVVLKPDHVRDVDLFVRRYGARAFGPVRYFKTNVPETDLEEVEPDDELPGGLLALDDGRRRHETPVYLPEQRALVFADGLTAPDGALRVWHARRYEQQVLPALRAMLELPFEHVLVSHGEPVHDRAEFERALGRAPWEGD